MLYIAHRNGDGIVTNALKITETTKPAGKGGPIRPTVAARLAEEARAIELEDATRAGTTGFMGRALVQATLPYREPPKDKPAWRRKAGNLSLIIMPGYEDDADSGEPVSIGYPYGTVPRLLLAWIAREAVVTKNRQLVLGDSLTQFMDALGLTSATGGKNGSITRVREQMKRLFAANMAITRQSDGENSERRRNFNVAEEMEFWWDAKKPSQAGLWQSTVTLSQRFYDEIVATPVPIDLRALRALRQSPMAIDVYCWLTYRNFSLSRPTTVPWESLRDQFGSEVESDKKFKDQLKKALHQVLTVYPAKATPGRTGLFLEPSKTSVPRLVKDW